MHGDRNASCNPYTRLWSAKLGTAALAPVVVGAVFQMTHSFPQAFGALAGGPLSGLVCMLFVHENTDS
jgi:hypothetical protein